MLPWLLVLLLSYINCLYNLYLWSLYVYICRASNLHTIYIYSTSTDLEWIDNTEGLLYICIITYVYCNINCEIVLIIYIVLFYYEFQSIRTQKDQKLQYNLSAGEVTSLERAHRMCIKSIQGLSSRTRTDIALSMIEAYYQLSVRLINENLYF